MYIHLAFVYKLTSFCIKTNLRENRFFAARWAVAGKKCTRNVKIYTKKVTLVDESTG